jgi:hypothetical protein
LPGRLCCLAAYGTLDLVSPPRARLGWSVAIAAGALGCVLFLSRSDDAQIRLRALNGTGDLKAYLWLVDHTRPQDLVVTELPSPAGRAALAAGVVWSLRGNHATCSAWRISPPLPGKLMPGNQAYLVEEAGPNATAYVILSNGAPVVGTDALIPVFRGGANTIYRAAQTGCPSSRG